MRKLAFQKSEFQVQSLPVEGSPNRVLIRHNATKIASSADTSAEAWSQLTEKLSNHYNMKVVIKLDVD